MWTSHALFIGGDWVEPASSEQFTLVNPSTEEVLGTVPATVESDVDHAVSAAKKAFRDRSGWSSWEPHVRAECMERLALALERRSDDMAVRVSSQNGMPIALSQQLEGAFPAANLRYYASLARDLPSEEKRPGLLGGTTLVRREPAGVVAGIVPWNVPQSLTSLKLAPALAAGCTVVLKPSPETLFDSYLLAEAVAEAEMPPGVVNIIPGDRHIGAYLVSHPQVNFVAFTGSSAAGRLVGEACGRLVRPSVLELGGKSAAIVLDDADLSLSMEELFNACFLNNGQVCYLCTRVLAPRSRYNEVVDVLTGLAEGLKIGHALDPNTQIGPLVSAPHRDRVERYIAKGRHEGRLTTGGGRPQEFDRGWFVEPTIFADVDNSSTIAREEIFGPVLSIIPFGDIDEAVQIANDSEYGLGGTVWTADTEHALEVARRIHTGFVGINGYHFDPTAPAGGVNASGIGYECGPEGLATYQRLKAVQLVS